ncbi:hypothetical protein PFWH6_5244 [Pseudomonas fluorescens WH6]|nr:hypothetical protein PFWH6_5244 [Pseudomonas fluorescens WH6]
MTPIHPQKLVVAHSTRAEAPQHEVDTNRALARWLAQVLGLEFGGRYDPQHHAGRELYVLPTQTLVGPAQALALNVRGPEDLWGGYVDHDFICTKAISHGLLGPEARAPEGWSPLFCERVRNVVLDGLSVFALEDARPAATRLLYSGPIRLKPVHACAGRGQEVIHSLDAFDAVLARPDAATLFNAGVVLEQDLRDVVTHSVGQSFIGEHVFSYCGEQYLTKDGQGEDVYGGSNLLVVPGYYEDLLTLDCLTTCVWLSSKPRSSTQPPTKPTLASTPRGATTTSPKAWTVMANAAAACSNNPGAWAGPAARKSQRCSASSTIRGSRRYGCPR